MNCRNESNPYEVHATNEITIVRQYGRPGMAKHYGAPIEGQPFHYRLLCSGQVIDAMAFGGALEYPTCQRCQRMDDPVELEVACQRVAVALGYVGAGGGWIYSPDTEQPVCQGWGTFARLRWFSLQQRGLIHRNAHGSGWYVDTLKAVAVAMARLTGTAA